MAIHGAFQLLGCKLRSEIVQHNPSKNWNAQMCLGTEQRFPVGQPVAKDNQFSTAYARNDEFKLRGFFDNILDLLL